MTERSLVVTPYTPTAEVDHGHAAYLRGLLRAMVELTDLVLVHPRHGALDPVIAHGCVAVETFEPAPSGFDRRRDLGSLARGTMLRSSGLDLDSIGASVRRLVREHDVTTVWAEGIELGDVAAAAPPPVRRIVVVHEAARFAQGRPATGLGDRAVQRLDLLAMRRQERRVVRSVDAVVTFTRTDASTVERAGGAPVHVLPLGWDAPSTPLDPMGDDDTLVFVGNYGHRPNVAAAVRAATGILPLIVPRRPDVELRLVGAEPPPEVVDLSGPNVTVTGRVAAVEAELDRAAVVLAPLDTGGGTRIKVLEALAAGKAVVATPLALDGLEPTVGDVAIVATDDREFADAVTRLLDHPDERVALGRAAHAWSVESASWRHVAEAHLALHRNVTRA